MNLSAPAPALDHLRIRELVDVLVEPCADAWDNAGTLPADILRRFADEGLFGAFVPTEFGGLGLSTAELGKIAEELGRGSMSLVSALTVHSMCTASILRWGTDEQKARWLPRLAKGEILGAFALTEPNIGSDARNVEAALVDQGDHYILTGSKKWITGGLFASVLLVFAQAGGQPTAVLVPTDSPGVTVTPIEGMLGFRAATATSIRFDGVVVPKSSQIAPTGMGFSHVVNSTLDLGRFLIACGSTGLIRACTEAAVAYARERKQFGTILFDHQLIREMIANMVTRYKAARALCERAAQLRDAGDPGMIGETTVAKYYASTAASQSANDCLQIHGANGAGPGMPIQRYFRDARMTEIIEGSNQIQQLVISQGAVFEFRKRKAKAR